MSRTADVLVVGGGVTGLCTALHLKDQGVRDVLVLERHIIGSGQSGRAAGVIRGTVRHATVSATQLEGQGFYRSFEERFGIPVDVHHVGYMLVATSGERAHVEATVEVARRTGCDLRLIGRDEAAEVQPGLAIDEDGVYAHEPGGVYVDPMPATHAIYLAARASGVMIEQGCEVGDIRVRDGRVIGVTTADGEFEAPNVLIATSVWGKPQLARLGIDVPVRPHIAQMAFFHAPAGSADRLRTIMFDSRAGLYMRPEGEAQMFVGRRESSFYREDGPPVDPDNYRQTAEFDAVERMHGQLSLSLPFMREGFVHRTYACTYDVTPDDMPILESAEGIEGLYYAVGFSGSGFSAAPWIGKRMAAFIAEGRKPADFGIFNLGRFAQGELISWSNTPVVRT
ncbi:MAG: hypothetical protein CMJ18_09650 [Phycisphaeraceae bacterium]|nr:hypothetical protein [Phycisphaeraceae bacterium]